MLVEALALEHLDRSLIEFARVRVVAVALADEAERAERGHEFGMVDSERALLDRERAPKATLGGLQVPAPSVNRCEVAERHPDFVMVAAEPALEDSERVLE